MRIAQKMSFGLGYHGGGKEVCMTRRIAVIFANCGKETLWRKEKKKHKDGLQTIVEMQLACVARGRRTNEDVWRRNGKVKISYGYEWLARFDGRMEKPCTKMKVTELKLQESHCWKRERKSGLGRLVHTELVNGHGRTAFLKSQERKCPIVENKWKII